MNYSVVSQMSSFSVKKALAETDKKKLCLGGIFNGE